MATIKRRIMSRSHIISLMYRHTDKNDQPHSPSMEIISADMMAHLLADGDRVKVYVDQDMGGPVVEYDDMP